MQTTIYRRIFIPFSTAVIVAAVAAWWIASSLISSTLEARLTDQVDHALNTLAAGSFPLTQDLLHQMAELQDINLVVFDQQDQIVLSTFTPNADKHVTTIHANVLDFWRNGTQPNSSLEVLVVRLSPGRSTEFAGIAGVADKSHVQQVALNVAFILGAVAAATIALLAWWGHRTSTAITRPMAALAELAEHIAQGERAQRAGGSKISELDDLALALNNMAERLAEFEGELADKKRLEGLGELAATVAHEVRNPLTAVKLQVQLLGEQDLSDRVAATCQRVLAEVQRLELIVNNTLTLGRPISVSPQTGNLNQVVTEVIELMGPQLEHRRIDLTVSLAELPLCKFDADSIKQVVFNLLTNAADALPEGGTVQVSSALLEGPEVIVTIEDSGPGLTESQQQQLAQTATAELQIHGSSKKGGMGIGLALCREIMRLHHGRFSAHASEVLGGAFFLLALPLSAATNNPHSDTMLTPS